MTKTSLSKQDLMAIARLINLKGRSKMTKEELHEAIFKGNRKKSTQKVQLGEKYDAYNISNEKIEELGKELEITFRFKTRTSRVKQIADELAKRMCGCIKEIMGKNERMPENRAIAICRSSVLQKRGVDIYTFRCKDDNGKISPSASPERERKFILKSVNK